MTLTNDTISSIIEEMQEKAFEQIDNARGDMKPSEVARILENLYGLGDIWADWWEESGDDYE